MSDPIYEAVRRTVAAAEPMWRDTAVEKLAREITASVRVAAPQPATTDDAVERAARAWSDHPLVRDGYEPMSDEGWREYWESPASATLRDRTAAMLAAAGAGEAVSAERWTRRFAS